MSDEQLKVDLASIVKSVEIMPEGVNITLFIPHRISKELVGINPGYIFCEMGVTKLLIDIGKFMENSK